MVNKYINHFVFFCQEKEIYPRFLSTEKRHRLKTFFSKDLFQVKFFINLRQNVKIKGKS